MNYFQAIHRRVAENSIHPLSLNPSLEMTILPTGADIWWISNPTGADTGAIFHPWVRLAPVP
jgi:hypothetical protein